MRNFGLGLAIAKSAVESMGTISARNGTPGTVFEVRLPEAAPGNGTKQ